MSLPRRALRKPLATGAEGVILLPMSAPSFSDDESRRQGSHVGRYVPVIAARILRAPAQILMKGEDERP